MRNDGRANDQLRPVKVTRRFTDTPAGSVLWEQGRTVVLFTLEKHPPHRRASDHDVVEIDERMALQVTR